MSTELIHKAVVAQFIHEVFQELSEEHLSGLVTERFEAHSFYGVPDDAVGVHHLVAGLRQHFRNPWVRVLELSAHQDKVMAHYLFEADLAGEDAARLGRVRVRRILIARMEGQRVAECWQEEDLLGILAEAAEAPFQEALLVA
jgi:hypothetical protein